MQETRDESEETLSLCDLPLYSDHQSVEWKQDHDLSQGSTDFFEFCNHELSPPENIIFCGKLIPHKKPQEEEEESKKLVETSKGPAANIKKKKKRGWERLRHVFCLGNKSKAHDLPPVHEMSFLTSSYSGKVRWHHLLFSVGVSRVLSSHEVKLKDMKNRRFPSQHDGGAGLTGLIRVLSCGDHHHPDTMVVAASTSRRK